MTPEPTPHDADVLLVEDSESDVLVARRALRRADLAAKLAVARDGQAALDYLRARRASLGRRSRHLPRVVLLDLKMPGLSGWDVLRELRSDPALQHVPVVVLSSSSQDEDVVESYRQGANSYVQKRFESRKPGAYLVDVVRYWLEFNRPSGPSPERSET